MVVIWDAVISAVKGIAAPVTELVKGWQERKRVALENELALSRAKTEGMIAMMRDKQAADIAWENLSIENSGWKDEWFTIVLSLPAILCFIPGMADYVRQGFESLQSCPEWYHWMLSVAVGSAFGVKKLADFMSLRKGV